MDTAERTWDASPLIGLVIIIPALFYFSWWWQFTGRYLQHAKLATAQVVSWERHVEFVSSRSGRGRNYTYYYTMVSFKNAAGQDTDGQIKDAKASARPGATVEVYYNPDHADVRFGGLDGVWGGLALVVGFVLLGIGLSIVAWVTTSRRALRAVLADDPVDEEWQEP